MPVTMNSGATTDHGTGAYQGPTEPETFEAPSGGPTGAYPGPSEPEVYESLHHLDGPTGAYSGPSEPETFTQWPAGETLSEDSNPNVVAPARATKKSTKRSK